jgi:small-conductance mechanosensitive channel
VNAVTNIHAAAKMTGLGDIAKPETWLRDLPNPDTWIGAIALALVILFAAWMTGRAVRLAILRYLDKSERAGADPTGIRFLGQLASVAVYVFAFLIYSHIVPALQKLGTAWLTSMGVVSVVLGLAAQSTLGNLISGISLVLYRPFKVGDRLEITGPKGAEIGQVESINLGTTVLRAADNRRLVIPNNIIASQILVNLSATRAGVACSISVMLASGNDVPHARKILMELAGRHPKTIKVDGCPVTAISNSGATLTLNAWCANADDSNDLKSDLLENAKKRFDAVGIKIV